MSAREQNNLEYAQSFLNSFRSLVKSLRIADRAGLKEHGLGASQVYVLHELQRESPLSVNALAQRTATDQSTVSVVVSNLIDKGLVRRERAKDDARRLDLTLTVAGRTVLRKLPPPIQWTIIEGVQRLPGGRAKLLAESLREVCELLGIAEEHPPMLMDDGKPSVRKRASPKAPSARRAAKPRRSG